MWKSNAPWKEGLNMEDPYYLPVPPIFKIVNTKRFPFPIIGDLLTIRTPKKFKPSIYLHNLNMKINPNQTLNDLHKFCDIENISHACLILGRIYEFGAYNQTEDQARAYQYYLKVRSLNDSSSNPMLSFYHRYYDYNIPISVIEADYSVSDSIVETILSTAYQFEKGLTRPMSCPTASNFLLPLADISSKMTYFHSSFEYNETEVAKMTNSSDPMDLYNLALHRLSVPYPSDNEIRIAKKLLKNSLSKGNQKAASSLARLAFLNLSGKTNLTQISNLLRKGYELNDPEAITIFTDSLFNSKNDPSTAFHAMQSLRKAADTGYTPAIHTLGFITYFGFFGVPRSNTKGFELFSKAAAKGYPPSIFNAAKQLIGGDGVVEDCSAAISMLRRIVDVGPWAKYLEKYVNKGSKHAFIKMLDMNLTPSGWINLTNTTFTNLNDNTIGQGIAKQKIDGSQTIENNADILNYLRKMSNSFISMENASITDDRIKRIRKAREGDGSSILWLSLKSPLQESLQWIDRMRLLPSPSYHLAPFVKLIVTFRALASYIKGDLKQDDINLFKKMILPFTSKLYITAITIVLMILISARINIHFRD